MKRWNESHAAMCRRMRWTALASRGCKKPGAGFAKAEVMAKALETRKRNLAAKKLTLQAASMFCEWWDKQATEENNKRDA